MRKQRSISTIIFDGEGVVVDTEPLWDAAQAEFLASLGRDYDRALIKPLLSGRSSSEGIRVLKRVLDLPGNPDELAEARMEIAKRRFENVKFVPGFLDFYSAVQGSFKTCLATAMHLDLLTRVDARLGLSDLFHNSVFTVADVAGRGKPAPDLLLVAAEALRSQPSECVVIEDAPNGVEAARRAGMACIGLTTTFQRQLLSNADLVVDSFQEIELRVLANEPRGGFRLRADAFDRPRTR